MRFFIIQHGLIDMSTHPYTETLGWEDACRRRGVEVRFFFNRRTAPSLLARFNGVPAFSYEPYHTFRVDPVIRRLYTHLELSQGVGWGCRALDEAGVRADDLVIVPYTTDRELLGVAWWLLAHPPAARPKVFFYFHTPDFAWQVDAEFRVLGDISLYRHAAYVLSGAAGTGRFHFCATNERLARALTAVMNQPCVAGPVAGVYADDPLPGAPDDPRPEERVDMCAIGQFRWEKGASLLLDVVRRVAAVRPAFSFFIQVHDRRAFEVQVRPQLDSIPKGVTGNVHIGDLDRDAYVRKLRAARTIVLPYRPERYALRISGVFAEAVAYGVPVVAPARTWMEDMLRAGYGAGILFTRFEADAVAAAVVSSLENAGHLRERAAVRRDEWRRKQSIDALVDHALAWQKS